MKTQLGSFSIISAFLVAVAGCTSAPETSEEQAWAKCNAIADRAVRSNCITLALADAKADERASERAAKAEFEAGAKAIEDKAAIERAMGAPEDETGSTIVRDPLEP